MPHRARGKACRWRINEGILSFQIKNIIYTADFVPERCIMQVTLSDKKQGIMGIAGHAGCGHCHSHNQYVQDDSGGLATVLALFQEATGLSLAIKEIRAEIGTEGYFEVVTESGGRGRAYARRGITLQEANLAKALIGREAIRTHALAMEAFGRIYGQGIHEAPVALQTAIANAALDSFVGNFPEQFQWTYEDLPGNCGLIAGAVLDFDGIPVSVLGTVNATVGGVGPNEDLEGNSWAAKSKRQVMEKLGMIDMPTIVVEGKVYSPIFSDNLSQGCFLVRFDSQWDNPFVGRSILAAGEKLGYPMVLREDVMARVPGALAKATAELGEKIIKLGQELKEAEFAQEKIDILARLALLVSQDGGGISFMTNRLHEIVGGVGIVPRTGAVVSYIVPLSEHKKFVVPFLTEGDVEKFVNLTKEAVAELKGCLAQAKEHIDRKRYPLLALEDMMTKREDVQ